MNRLLLLSNLTLGILGSIVFRHAEDIPLFSWFSRWNGGDTTFQFFSPEIPARPRVILQGTDSYQEFSPYLPNRESGLRVTNFFFNVGLFRDVEGFVSGSSGILQDLYGKHFSVYWLDPLLQPMSEPHQGGLLCYKTFFVQPDGSGKVSPLSQKATASLCSE